MQQTSQEACTICLNTVEDPRVVGNCLHYFCLRCLKGYIGELKDGDAFMCPLCRQTCVVPNLGLDALEAYAVEPSRQSVGAPGQTSTRTKARPGSLKMADKFQKLNIAPKTAPKGNEPPCSVCHEIGSSKYCKTCHDLYICAKCTEVHSQNPLTKDHNLLEVCSLHGKPLEFFCQNCGCGVCSVCLIAQHAGNAHSVISVFDMVATIGESFYGMQGEVDETVEVLDAYASEMAESRRRLNEQQRAEAARKENESKQKSEAESRQLDQVQQDIATTWQDIATAQQKLTDLLQQEKQLKTQQNKTIADSKAAAAKYQEKMTATCTKVDTLRREVATSKKTMLDYFGRGQVLLQKNLFSVEHINMLQTTATEVSTALALAKKTAQASEKSHQEMQPLIKGRWIFSQRCSDSITVTEENTVARFRPLNQAWGGVQYWRQHAQFGLVIVHQPVSPGDEVEIEIGMEREGDAAAPVRAHPGDRLRTKPASRAVPAFSHQQGAFYAGFTNIRPDDVNFNTCQPSRRGGGWMRSVVDLTNGITLTDFTTDMMDYADQLATGTLFLAKRTQPRAATITWNTAGPRPQAANITWNTAGHNANLVVHNLNTTGDKELYLCFVLSHFNGYLRIK